MRYIIGDLLTGRRIQNVPALSGSWSEVLNRPGELACTVTLDDESVRRLDLANSATPRKAFLAAIEGDTVLQAGPIVQHRFVEGRGNHLDLVASGLWSYFDARVILPFTALNPSDPATDTNLVSSLQGIARAWAEQAMSWPSGDLPVILPDEIPGTSERNEPGANLASVGSRLSELTRVENGPDIQFAPRLTADRLGVEWTMRIGTPTQPMLHAPQDIVFNVGTAGSSVSNLTVTIDGTNIATGAYASGGRSSDTVLIAVAENSTLTDLGYPRWEVVDSSHSTVSEPETMQAWASELVHAGRVPVTSLSFDHDLSQRPFVYAFTVGDFASVRIKEHPYLGTQTIRMRITSRSGTLETPKVRVSLQPEED